MHIGSSFFLNYIIKTQKPQSLCNRIAVYLWRAGEIFALRAKIPRLAIGSQAAAALRRECRIISASGLAKKPPLVGGFFAVKGR